MKPKSILNLLLRLVHCKTSEQRRELWRGCAFEYLQLPVIYTDQHGLRYVLYPGQNAQVYFQHRGNYEVAETRFCLNFVQPGMVAFDVGANIGLYTLLLAKLVGSEGQVHAFEPEAQNYQRLVTNVALNGFKNVTTNREAVFSESKTLQLNVFPDNVNAWHSLGRPILPDPYHPGRTLTPNEQQTVPGVSLDDYCALAGITQIDFLKVDVEGAELEVLQGAERLLGAGAIAALLFEVSLPQMQAMSHQPPEIFSMLCRFSLRSFPLAENGRLLPEVETSQAHYQNFVALRDEITAHQLAVDAQ